MQLSRHAGFNLQAASRALNGLPAKRVTRPGKWGNPFTIEETATRYGLDRAAAQVEGGRALRRVAARHARPEAVAACAAEPRGDPRRAQGLQSRLLVQARHAVPRGSADRDREREGDVSRITYLTAIDFGAGRAQDAGDGAGGARHEAAAAGRRQGRGGGGAAGAGAGAPAGGHAAVSRHAAQPDRSGGAGGAGDLSRRGLRRHRRARRRLADRSRQGRGAAGDA